ncbi:MAG: hypothetical protein JW791_04880 [Nanoarchaeota archaeon]|nr:hypothetical protein [Nanoarchaeota archaeon]
MEINSEADVLNYLLKNSAQIGKAAGKASGYSVEEVLESPGVIKELYFLAFYCNEDTPKKVIKYLVNNGTLDFNLDLSLEMERAKRIGEKIQDTIFTCKALLDVQIISRNYEISYDSLYIKKL